MEQFAAEHSQSSYETILESQDPVIGNYTQVMNAEGKSIVSDKQRERIVSMMYYLVKRKEYKVETFYVAVSIMDRYFNKLINVFGYQNTPNWVQMAAVCVLMAAKLNQPVSPSFNRMIEQIPEDKRQAVSKSALIQLEFKIVTALEFELQWAGPMVTLERYLYLLGFHKNTQVYYVAREVSKYVAHKADLCLTLRPSEVAAIAATLALNVLSDAKVCKALKIDCPLI